jgi:hypothetical protein
MKNLAIMILVPLMVLSCEKEVILDLSDMEGSYIIVEANITDGDYMQWIKITNSMSYYETNDGKGLTGARVWIENYHNPSESYSFYHQTIDKVTGYYFNEQIFSNLEGKTMKLNIEYNHKQYTALSHWQPLPDIDSLSISRNPFNQFFYNDTIYDIKVHFRNLPESHDYYLFNLYVNDTLRTVQPSEKGLLTDAILGEYVSMPVLSFNNKNVKEGDELRVEMRSISRENFDFYKIFLFQTDLSGNPFAGAPPANIPTNLSAGAMGFFQISAVKKATIICSTLP